MRRGDRLLAATLLVLASLSARADAPAAPCRVAGVPHEVLCGHVTRALDPARPDGPSIDVHYVLVPALARNKRPDPVFLLAGGPGQSAIALAPAGLAMFGRLANRRDIVFVDQRGTGRSAPLDCADEPDTPLADHADRERQVRRIVVDCQAALRTLPYVKSAADLGLFTTTLAMQDLDAVRRQLGVQRIDLVGASYGSRAGLEYLRQFPHAVRRLVLDGVAPPDMVLPASFSADNQAALDALLAACDAEAACTAAYPALRAQWTAVLRSLPRTATLADPRTGRAESVTLTRALVLGAVRSTLYAPLLASALPAAIDAAAGGRFEPLAGLAAMVGRRPATRLYTGMHFSVVCAEDAPRLAASTERPAADFGDDFAALYRSVCEAWPRGAVPAAFYTVPPSPVPALLLSGSVDPATPPRHAARVAQALGPSARHVVVPNTGHGVLSLGCMREVLQRFIDAEDDAAAAAVDAGCAAAVPRPPAFLPLAKTLPAPVGAAK